MESKVTPRRLRVLVLSWRDGDHPEGGGAETYLERTSQVLTARGHEVTLFAATFPGATASVQRGDVRIVRRGGRFLCYARGMQYLRAHEDDFDVVVDVLNGVPFWSPLVTSMPVVTLVHHVHKDQWPIIFGRGVGHLGWLVESRAAPLVYRHARYVTVSKATRDDLVSLGVAKDRIAITYSGNDHPADLAAYAHLPRTREPSLVVLGRLVPHKHVEKAIDVVAALSDAHPEMTLHVVGTGYWADELRAYAARRGVADRVTFHGFVDDHTKREILARSWLMVMPSQKEGWGLTIVEAGLHGTPCVAFAYAGGVTESVVDGVTGRLVADDAGLAVAVDEIVRDRDLRERLGRAAHVHAASFTWENTALQLEEVLLDAARPRD